MKMLGEEAKHYLSFESPQMMEQFEATYYRCVHTTINAMQVRGKAKMIAIYENSCNASP